MNALRTLALRPQCVPTVERRIPPLKNGKRWIALIAWILRGDGSVRNAEALGGKAHYDATDARIVASAADGYDAECATEILISRGADEPQFCSLVSRRLS